MKVNSKQEKTTTDVFNKQDQSETLILILSSSFACSYPLLYCSYPLLFCSYPLLFSSYSLLFSSYPLLFSSYPLFVSSYYSGPTRLPLLCQLLEPLKLLQPLEQTSQLGLSHPPILYYRVRVRTHETEYHLQYQNSTRLKSGLMKQNIIYNIRIQYRVRAKTHETEYHLQYQNSARLKSGLMKQNIIYNIRIVQGQSQDS